MHKAVYSRKVILSTLTHFLEAVLEESVLPFIAVKTPVKAM